jgi:hypothetical protein
LNSRVTARKHGSYNIDPVLAERFNAIVEATDAKVVLSSTHRLYEETRCGVLAAVILSEAVRLICPRRLALMKLQRGCKTILKLNAMLSSTTGRCQAIHYSALLLGID